MGPPCRLSLRAAWIKLTAGVQSQFVQSTSGPTWKRVRKKVIASMSMDLLCMPMEVSISNIKFQSWLFFFLDQESIACLDREEPE